MQFYNTPKYTYIKVDTVVIEHNHRLFITNSYLVMLLNTFGTRVKLFVLLLLK